MTKPEQIAAGIGVAGVVCAALAGATSGLARAWWTWTAASCAAGCATYALNRPQWLGKRAGRQGARAVLVLPYLLALRTSFALMRWWRGRDLPTPIVSDLWVGGRLGSPASLPGPVTHVVDLVAEYSAHPAIRALPGYRSLPVLDGGVPPDVGAFLALVHELSVDDPVVLVHCDSGRGRAPTFAAALLVARGRAPDVATALAMVRTRRPVAAPTRADLRFLARVATSLEALGRERRRRAAATAGARGARAAPSVA